MDWYRHTWQRIRHEFDTDPADAVRHAHALILVYSPKPVTPASSLRGAIQASGSSGMARFVRDSAERVSPARDIQAAVQSVLAGGAADGVVLRAAMDEYGRIMKRVSEGSG